MTNTIDINGLSYMRVGDITVGTATTSVSFTGLDIGKDDDYLIVSEVLHSGSGTMNLSMYINSNINATNYYTQAGRASGTTIDAFRYNDGIVECVTAGRRNTCFHKIKLTNSGYYVSQNNAIREFDNASNLQMNNFYTTSTFTMTSITTITLTSSVASAIGIGSRFQLYKLVAEKVADIIVSTATTSVDITGLNIDKNSEYMLVSNIISPVGGAGDRKLYINNNTIDSNYYSQRLYASASTIFVERVNLPYGLYNNANSSTLAYINIKLTNSGYFTFISNGAYTYGGNGVCIDNAYGTSTFTTTSITSLKITASVANAIGIGSRFQLYRIK